MIFENDEIPQWFPRLTLNREGKPVDDSLFDRMVLEDSDKILYMNRRIARGFAKLVRIAFADRNSRGIGGGYYDWYELDNSLPDE